ncbi:hypothetical protein Tco_0852434 [Tanacetum coccineum]
MEGYMLSYAAQHALPSPPTIYHYYPGHLIPQVSSPPLPPPPSSLHLPPYVPTSLPLPSSPLPPLLVLLLYHNINPEEVDYGIKDVWVDPAEAVKEVALTTLERVNDRVAELAKFYYETARLLDQEALVSREAWSYSVGLSSAVHYELQAYMTIPDAIRAKDQTHADDPEGADVLYTARAAATAIARAAAADTP